MQKVFRQILIEISWLTLSLGLTILLFLFVSGWSFPETIDIHLHDAVIVISRWHILTPLFFLITFIVYFIKESRRSFEQALPNCLLIAFGLTLVILLTFLIQAFSQFSIGTWTLYPPLSALDKDSEMSHEAVTRFLRNILSVMQIAIIVMLLFVAYRWGEKGEKLIGNYLALE